MTGVRIGPLQAPSFRMLSVFALMAAVVEKHPAEEAAMFDAVRGLLRQLEDEADRAVGRAASSGRQLRLVRRAEAGRPATDGAA